MASQNFLELQNLSVESINAELTQAKADLIRMRFDHKAKGLQNPLELKTLKKTIARFQTELRAREIKTLSSEELAKRSKIRLRRK